MKANLASKATFFMRYRKMLIRENMYNIEKIMHTLISRMILQTAIYIYNFHKVTFI